MKKPPIKTLLPYLILLSVISFHALMGAVWIVQNQALQGDDEVDYIQVLQRFDRAWPEGWSHPLGNMIRLTDSIGGTSYPPLPAILGVVAMKVGGRNPASLRALSLLAYLGTILLCFLIGRAMKDSWTGAIGALVLSGMPYLMVQSRFFNVFAISAFFVSLTLFILLRTKSLTRPVPALFFGFALGLALLAERGSPALILFGPVGIYSAMSIFRPSGKLANNTLLPAGLLVVALGIAAAISSRFVLGYLLGQGDYIAQNVQTPFYPERAIPSYYVIKGIRWLTDRTFGTLLIIGAVSWLLVDRARWKYLAGWCGLYLLLSAFNFNETGRFVIAALPGLAIFFVESRERGVLLAWIYLPLALFSLIATRHIQYVVGVMPALALCFALFAREFSQVRYGRWITGGIVGAACLLMLFQAVVLSFDSPGLRAAYDDLPPFFRFAGGQEKFYPQKSPQEATARRLLNDLNENRPGQTGVLVYLPGPPSKEPDVAYDFYFPAPGLRAMTLQVWVEFLQPGMHHLVIGQSAVTKSSLARPDEDRVAFLPWTPAIQTQFERDTRFDMGNPVQVLGLEQPALDALSLFDHLPGREVNSWELAPGRRLVFADISEQTKEIEPSDSTEEK